MPVWKIHMAPLKPFKVPMPGCVLAIGNLCHDLDDMKTFFYVKDDMAPRKHTPNIYLK